MAAPFVQGRLTKKRLSVEIQTECAHCERRIRLVVGSNLKFHIEAGGVEPLLFEPEVNWSKFTDPTIIHAY
jgi:hypothetical protein